MRDGPRLCLVARFSAPSERDGAFLSEGESDGSEPLVHRFGCAHLHAVVVDVFVDEALDLPENTFAGDRQAAGEFVTHGEGFAGYALSLQAGVKGRVSTGDEPGIVGILNQQHGFGDLADVTESGSIR